jgi:hypothetical protein
MANYLSPNFFIGSIRIGTVEGASCVNLGNNTPAHFTNHKKHNQGFGTVSGDHNEILGARSVLDDSDLLDMLNVTDPDVPQWVKDLLSAEDDDSEDEDEEDELEEDA